MLRIILLLVFISYLAFSAEDEDACSPNNNLLSFNLLNLIPVTNFPFVGIDYQRKIDCNSSIGGEISIPVFNGISGYRGGAEYRYYPLGTALEKLYFAPRLLYTDISDDIENESSQVVTLGVLVAWNFQGRHFSSNLGFGLDYNTGPTLQDTELREGDSNTTPHLRFSLGWSW